MNKSKAAIIFDFNRTLFDPTIYALYHGVTPMLQELQRERPLILFSKKGWDRQTLLDQLGVGKYFAGTHFVDRKTPDNLKRVLKEHGLDPSTCVMVGDMLADEICVGGEIGMKTVWFQQSRFGAIQSGEPPCVPHYTVHSIPELRELLKKI